MRNFFSPCIRTILFNHLMQEWRFLVKCEQIYKFFQFFRKSGVVNSIIEKKIFFFVTHQNNLIQSVEHNLTIECKNGDFSSSSFFHKERCLLRI